MIFYILSICVGIVGIIVLIAYLVSVSLKRKAGYYTKQPLPLKAPIVNEPKPFNYDAVKDPRFIVQYGRYYALVTKTQLAKIRTIKAEHNFKDIKVFDYEYVNVSKLNCTITALFVFYCMDVQLDRMEIIEITNYLGGVYNSRFNIPKETKAAVE